MTRHPFGWSYPPGAANDPSAPWNQVDGPCAVCHKPVDACVCHDCPVCGELGRPECYGVNPHTSLSRDQNIAIAQHHIAEAKERLTEAELALDYILHRDHYEGNTE
jgi:hypothetical protein